MKYKKVLLAAFMGSIGFMSYSANAAISVTAGDIFLVAYNSDAKDTFVAKLSGLTGVGQVNTFSDSVGNLSFNLVDIDSNWTTFTATATTANTQYQIIGLDTTNRRFINTSNGAPVNPIGTTQEYNTLAGSATTAPTGAMYQFLTGNNVTTTATSFIDNSDGATSGNAVGSAWFSTMNGSNIDTTVSLGSNASFYLMARGAVSPSSAITTRPDVFGTWNLSDAGMLTYTSVAAVPEADASLMMMAGLGLMGFIARRKKLV